MSKKCPGCNKTVYFAERQVKDGVDWHGSCLIRHVQDQKKGAQASNPFQSYRGSPSPSAPRREGSRPSSIEVGFQPQQQPTSPAPVHKSDSPVHTRPDRSPEPVISQLSNSTEAPAPTSTPTPETVAPSSPVASHSPVAEQSPVVSPSPTFFKEERKNSNSQLSKVEEFLQQSASSTAPSSLTISVDAEPAEAQPEGETGFCSNCGEPRGTDGAKFCSNCGDELF